MSGPHGDLEARSGVDIPQEPARVPNPYAEEFQKLASVCPFGTPTVGVTLRRLEFGAEVRRQANHGVAEGWWR